MKKKILAMGLCFMISLGAFSLSACNPETTYYQIIATSSNNYGAGTTTGSGPYLAGSKVTLTATPKENHQFLAWIKNEDIVATTPQYSFNINSTNYGKYIALFTDNDFDFAKLTNVQYILQNLTLTNTNYTPINIISWDLAYKKIDDPLYSKLANFENLEVNANFDNLIEFQEKVFFSKQTYYFKLDAKFEYINTTSGVTTSEIVTSNFMVDLNNIFSDSATTINATRTFTSDKYKIELISGENNSKTLMVTLKALNYSSQWAESSRNTDNQNIILTFNYPFNLETV